MGADGRCILVLSKIKSVIHLQLTQGLSPEACRAAIAMAFTLGIFPIMGFSTPLNMLAAFVFRLNQPVVQAFNWILGPIKIALIFPFLRIGEWLFGAEPFVLSLTQFSAIFFADWIGTTKQFALTFVHAITGWLLCAPLVFLLLYILSKSFVDAGLRFRANKNF